MRNFCACIVSCVLVLGQVIYALFFYHAPYTVTMQKTEDILGLGWIVAFFTALWGLALPKEKDEKFKRLYYWGKTICAIVLIFQVPTTLWVLYCCVKYFSNWQ